MRDRLTLGSLVALIALLLTACVVAPPAGTPSPLVGVLSGDGPATKYGVTGREVIDNPAIHDKVRALFGPDWRPAPESGGKLAAGAAAFFGISSPPQAVRMSGTNYIAVTGCITGACGSHRGLLLIREDGELLLARVDEGGYSHYYAFGVPGERAATGPAVVDGAWRALQRTASWRLAAR